jgi:hypothetical protein
LDANDAPPYVLRRFAPSVKASGRMPRSSAVELVGNAMGTLAIARGE